jgi:hypothetical protein
MIARDRIDGHCGKPYAAWPTQPRHYLESFEDLERNEPLEVVEVEARPRPIRMTRRC